MSKPRRHHFIPQMLSKRFIDDSGYLYVFEKGNSNKRIDCRKPKGVFWKHHYYTSETDDGQKDTSLEEDYSKLESDTSPVIEKIVNAARKGETPDLTEDEKTTWDRFFYTQWKRTPDNMEKVGIDEVFDSTLKETITELGAFRPLTNKEKKNFSNPECLARMKKNAQVDAQKINSSKILETLKNKGLSIAKIDYSNKSFIIGSLPIVKLTDGNRTLLSDPTVEVWLPIAHDIAVSPFFERGKEKVIPINTYHVRRLNRLFFRQSNVIAGRSKELIRSLAFPR